MDKKGEKILEESNKKKSEKYFCNSDCKNMHQMGVPLEKGEWLELSYLMRTIRDQCGMSEKQKQEIQQRLIFAFKKKEFEPELYLNLLSELEEIRHLMCYQKMDGLEAILKGMSKALAGMSKDVGELMESQVVNISSLSKTTDKIQQGVQTQKSPEVILPLISELKDHCKQLVSNALKVQQKLKEEAAFDEQTRLYNRKTFNKLIEESMTRYKSEGTFFSLIFVDIDNFKNFNDTYGHLVGDQVLEAVAGEIRRNVRAGDIPARYGGEEFVVIIEDTNPEEACLRAEVIREAVNNHEFVIRGQSKMIQISVSLGVSRCREEWKDLEVTEIIRLLIKEADDALYQAKRSGKNRVCLGQLSPIEFGA